MSNPVGRPSIRTTEVEDYLFIRLKKGIPLHVICREKGMPCADTIYNWAHADPKFSRRLALARPKKVNPSEAALVLKMASNGKRYHEIAEATGLTRRQVELRVYKSGVTLAKGRPKGSTSAIRDPKITQSWVKLREAGMSFAAIGGAFGVTAEAVRQGVSKARG